MKAPKLLLLAAVPAMMLASCANDEPVNVRTSADDAITFRTGMGSRATETTNDNLSEMYVTAFTKTTPYFENALYTKGNDSFFTSSSHYSWLADRDTITFRAYSPSQALLGADITVDGQSMVMNDFSVAEEIADQQDFITANATGTKEANGVNGVELTFDHRLSQIQVDAKSSSDTYNYQVVGVRIGRVQYMGSFDFVTSKWTLDEWHDTAIYDASTDAIDLTSDAQTIMGPSGNAMLMPQELNPWDPTGDPDNVARQSYISVQVRITRKDNGMVIYPYPTDNVTDENGQLRKYAWASVPLGGEWLPGMKYIYTLDFTNGAGNVDPDDPTPGDPVLGDIKFKVTVNPWVDSNQDTPMTPKW